VIVVGAGAAGLMAAIFAARERPRSRVTALDGARKIGAKILISGGGRCNVTHDVVSPADFNGGSRNTIARILRTFDVEPTVAFFRELGVHLKREETGKLFPVTDRASTVLDALLRAAAGAGVEIVTGCRVTAIDAADGFSVATSKGELHADSVVIATGGMSVPSTGSDGAGYELARRLGHTVTRTFPALVPLLLPKGHRFTSLAGIAVEAELTVTSATGKVLHRDRGSMLFTHFGLSGPVVLDVSRHWIAAAEEGGARLVVSMLPGSDAAEVDAALRAEAAVRPRASTAGFLRARFPERLAGVLLAEAEVPAERPLGRLTREERGSIVRMLTSCVLPVTGDRGFRFAEVTAGGVALSEIDPATMESRRCPRLYLCGEILDVDGRIGGYNFQWAWASGRLAGMNAR
jgi:predicted Rossmann fold flavoprotein